MSFCMSGAHRTGSTSFQQYLRAHRAGLEDLGIGFWGPWRTRTGLLDGIVSPDRAGRRPRAAPVGCG